MKKISFGIFLLVFYISSYANCVLPSGGGISGFDTILNTYANTAVQWSAAILPKTTYIFWIIFSLEFLYQVVFKKIIAFDIQKLYVFFVIRIFTVYMFAYVFLNINFYLGIISYFTNLGSTLGGSAINLSGGATGMAISPSSVMSYLECYYAIPSTALANSNLSALGGELFAILLFAVLALIIIIPVILMITMIDAYVVIFAGFILAGFAGSSWTQSYWQRYFSYVSAVAIRLFLTCLILGIVMQSFTLLDKMTIPQVTTGVYDPKATATYIEAMFGLLVLNALILIIIPNKASSILKGSINLNLGDVISGASMVMSSMRGGDIAISQSITSVNSVYSSNVASNTSVVNKTNSTGKAREIMSTGYGSSITSSNASSWTSANSVHGSSSPGSNWKK